MIYKLFILSLFYIINIFSMDEYTRTLPAQMWAEIAKLGIDRNAKTEKEVFETLDNLRLVDKKINSAVDLVKSKFCKEFKIEEKNCYYINFKLKLMDQIISEKAEKKVIEMPEWIKQSPFTEYINKWHSSEIQDYLEFKQKMNTAIDMKALNWIKEYFFKNSNKIGWTNYKDSFLRTYFYGCIMGTDKGMQDDWGVNHDFDKMTKKERLERLEYFLKIGSNPNVEIQFPNIYGVLKGRLLLLAVQKKDKDLVNLLLKYGADPFLINWDFNMKWATPLKAAKELLYEEQGTVGYYFGTAKETEKTKNLKEIIKSLENAMNKNK